MPQFTYRARNYAGELITGTAEAPGRDALEKSLGNQGLIPISAAEVRKSFDLQQFKASFEHVNTDDLIIFTRQLGTMYRAGIPFVRTLDAVSQQTSSDLLKKIMTEVRTDVERGETFSNALSKYPHVFNELYVSMIEAGEAGGVLDEILDRLSNLLEKDAEIKSKIKSATLYPKIVVGAIVIAVVVLVSFVIPKFASLYGRFGVSLPMPTRVLLVISGLFTKFWYLMAALAAFSVVSFRHYTKSGAGRKLWDRIKIQFPIFGHLMLTASMARFSMILGTLLKSGLPILTSLEISGRATGNIVLSEEIERIRNEIRGGKPLFGPMEESSLFPPMMVQMVTVGEETGNLDDMLLNVSDHLSKEVDYTIRNLSTLIEPILLSIIFGMVLFMALALFLPMWDMVRLVRGGR